MAHVPDLVRYGSKPRREIAKSPDVEGTIARSLRTFAEASSYPPNGVFIGRLSPDELREIPRPWFDTPGDDADACGRFGRIIPQDELYELIRRADVQEPPLLELTTLDRAMTHEIHSGLALTIWSGDDPIGCFRRDTRAEGREDPSLGPNHLLENLCAKATGAMALESLLERQGIGAEAIDYIITCGEEACGDRYQRGGGGMAKSIGEMCGCVNASGMDIKNFCAAPASALVTAGALVMAGQHRTVAVVGGGSLAKLGMKFQALLQQDMPILDDCLASMAFLVTADDGRSPILHLEPGAVGLAPIGSSTSDESVYRNFLLKPLQTLGLRMSDIDKYAPELHNPELMEVSGSGDVVKKNYRMIAALGVITGEIEKSDMKRFVERVGMPGFAPTQGHIPSGVPYLGHAAAAMERGEIRRSMILAKASLFLNRLTELYDGVSFVLEANPGR
jgi:betaine reductase